MTPEHPDAQTPPGGIPSPTQVERSPSAATAPRGPEPEPTPDDVAFVRAMQNAGLLEELDADELHDIATHIPSRALEARRLDLLERYYAACADPDASARRTRRDRFFAHRDGTEGTASQLVQRLAAVLPELGELTLERIGASDGPVVLRAGEDRSAVVDEYEEQLDTGEVDLRDVDGDFPTVPVRGLVRAVNGLLSRRGMAQRMVELLGDGRRELYVAVRVAEATSLLQSGYLEDDEPEELMEFGSW